MKKIIAAAILICIIFWLNKSAPNPVVEHIINEFMFDSTGWKLELYNRHFNWDTLDTWRISSANDTAYCKPGICFNEEGYLVLTQDSLKSKLNINPEGDILGLSDSVYNYLDSSYFFVVIDYLRFGPNGFISSPKTGQSIRVSPYSSDEYLLDNSPTIGTPNDSTDIEGSVEGLIKDSLNNPIPGVKVIYGYTEFYPQPNPIYVLSDSTGFFFLSDYAKLGRLEFNKEGFFAPDTALQIWPDSTVTLNIKMSLIVGVKEITPVTLNKFELTQNFPNPFNSSTSFFYFLPEDEDVEIIIYNQNGEIVQKLFKGFQSKGQYRINWNTNETASGIYFYELKAGSRKLVKKCLLLK